MERRRGMEPPWSWVHGCFERGPGTDLVLKSEMRKRKPVSTRRVPGGNDEASFYKVRKALSSKFRVPTSLNKCPLRTLRSNIRRIASPFPDLYHRFKDLLRKKRVVGWNSNQIIRYREFSSGMRNTHAGDAPHDHDHGISLPLPEFTLRLRD